MSFVPRDVGIFGWIKDNRASSSIDLFTNNMPESIARGSPIDFSFEAYENSRENARDLLVSELSRIYKVEPDMITPTVTGSAAIFLALLFIRQKSDQIGVLPPEYPPIIEVSRSLGFDVKTLRSHQIKRGDIAVALSIPKNPTGTVRKLLQSVEELPAFWEQPVFVDETFLEFTGKNPETSFEPGSSMLVSSSTTKYYGLTDLKVGWIFADEENTQWLGRAENLITPVMPQYPLWVSYQALKHKDYFDSIVSKRISANTKIVDDFVNDVEVLSWKKPEGAPFGFIRTGSRGSVPLCLDILLRTGILLGPGRYFGDDTGFRLSFVLPEEQLTEALDKLKTYFQAKA